MYEECSFHLRLHITERKISNGTYKNQLGEGAGVDKSVTL